MPKLGLLQPRSARTLRRCTAGMAKRSEQEPERSEQAATAHGGAAKKPRLTGEDHDPELEPKAAGLMYPSSAQDSSADDDALDSDEDGSEENSLQNGLGDADAVGFNCPDGICLHADGQQVFVSDGLNHRIVQLDGRDPDFFQRHAGGSSEGFLDGPDMEALFCCPKGLTVAGNGDLLIADSENHVIRRVNADSGEVDTFAGCGEEGFLDGPAEKAMFACPMGIVCNSKGICFVLDSVNHRIRTVDADGNVSTFAGCGTKGYRDGAGTTAMFNHPVGIAVDKEDNILVGDTSNHLIRIVSPAGDVKTLAGSRQQGFSDGKARSAKFSLPQGLAVDSSGNVVVADSGNDCIRKITADGVVSTVAGTREAGFDDGEKGSFDQPVAVACDGASNVYVVDQGNHAVRLISTGKDGLCVVSTLSGLGEAVDVTSKDVQGSNSNSSNMMVGCTMEPNTRDYLVFEKGM